MDEVELMLIDLVPVGLGVAEDVAVRVALADLEIEAVEDKLVEDDAERDVEEDDEGVDDLLADRLTDAVAVKLAVDDVERAGTERY